jgi:chemotaxis protein methyltransferase CheR
MSFNPELSTSRNGVETLLRDLVFERTGLFFDETKLDIFTGKIGNLLNRRGFTSFLDYYYLLKYDTDSVDEWANVIDALAVQETYFWREMDQITALSNEVIRALLSAKTSTQIRIWCAACATGEEPLTIAIRLNEDGWFERADIKIFATDASPAAISRAREGLYGGRSFRALPDALKTKYFAPEGKFWRVDPDLHRRVSYGIANLVERDSTDAYSHVPIIFCRNVFIYFTLDTVRDVVESFAKTMQVPGFLFVGAAESLLKATDRFELEEIGDAFVYTKQK